MYMQGIKALIFVFATLGLVFFLAPRAWAQTGTVKSEGQPLPGATVRATQGDRVLTTLTDGNGEFKLDKMTPGAWTMDVAMFGFAAGHREVQIGASPSKIDFTLEIGTFPAAFGGGGRGGSAWRRRAGWRRRPRRWSRRVSPKRSWREQGGG